MEAELFNRPKGILEKIAKQYGTYVLVAQIFAIVIFPVIEIILTLPDVQPAWYIWLIVGVIHLLVGIFAIFSTLRISEYLDVAGIHDLERRVNEELHRRDGIILEAQESTNRTMEENEQIYFEIEQQLRQQIDLQFSIAVLNELISNKDINCCSGDVEKILTPLIKDRSKSLEFRNNEYYNFAVYILDSSDGKLKVYYRACDDRIERRDRPWAVGVGHVGITYANCETIVKSDATNDSEYQTKSSYATDKTYYASYISSPIFNNGKTKDFEHGVFVVTSDRPGHFQDDDKSIIESYAFLLSIYFSICSRLQKEGENVEKSEKDKTRTK